MTAVPEASRRRRFWIWASLVATVFGVGFGVLIWYETYYDREVARLIAQLDAEGPHWRLEDIEAGLPILSAEDDAMALARKICAKPFPNEFHEASNCLFQLLRSEANPSHCLTALQVEKFQLASEGVKDRLPEAKRLLGMRSGRLNIQVSDDYFGTALPHIQEIWIVNRLLSLECMESVEARDYEAAIRASQDLFRLNVTLTDDRFLWTHGFRASMRILAAELAQFVLAQGTSKAEPLADLQRMYEEVDHEMEFRKSLRVQIAGIHHCFENWNRGKISGSSLMMSYSIRPSYDPRLAFLDAIETDRLRKVAYALLLRQNMEKIQSADESFVQQLALEKKHHSEQSTRRWPGVLAYQLGQRINGMPEKIISAEFGNRAFLQASIAGLALERYRLDHGAWPGELNQLVPKYLSKIPDDPFTSKPLLFKKTRDGVVVYSVGATKSYDGGFHDLRHPPEGASNPHLEFRLWNIESRRQARK